MNCGSGCSASIIGSFISFTGGPPQSSLTAAVLAQGLTKKDTVPDTAIETALARKRKFEQDPAFYTFEES